MLTEVLGGCRLDPAIVGAKVVPKAPGMKYKHYAPNAPMTLLEGDPKSMPGAFRRTVRRLQQEGRTVGVLASHEVVTALQGLVPQELLADYGPQGDLLTIAANIYEELMLSTIRRRMCCSAKGRRTRGLALLS